MDSKNISLVKAVISLVLPPVILVISFALAIASSLSAKWAESSLYDPVNSGGGATGLWPNRTTYRGVFYECTVVAANSDDSLAAPNRTCTRFGLNRGSCHVQFNKTTGDYQTTPAFNQHLCQQVTLSGRLLVAGIVLLGIAMILAAVIAVLSWRSYNEASPPQYYPAPAEMTESEIGDEVLSAPTPKPNAMRRSSGPAWIEFLTHPTRLFIVFGTVLLVFTELLAVNALVNDAPPNGDFLSTGGIFSGQGPTNNGPWYMGRVSLALMPAAWVLSGFTAWISIWTWS